MTDDERTQARALEGTRAAVTVDGSERTGTITAVTYTLKGGQPVVAIELDEPIPDGNTGVAVALDEVRRL